MFALIKKRVVLWFLFAATVLLTLSFSWVGSLWGMTFLDALSSPEEAKALVQSLNPEQIRVHIWTTAVLDVLYPLAYGGLFAGVALASFRHFGLLLALPSLLVIPVDIAEGVVQIYGLSGQLAFLDWKAYLTPLKFMLFFIGFGIAVVGWGKWLMEALRSRANTPG